MFYQNLKFMKKLFSNASLMILALVMVLGISLNSDLKAQDPPETNTVCWNIYQGTWIGGSFIWRCLPPGSCETKRAKEWSVKDGCITVDPE
tara:strand:- start:414 stop:686 length:273 start_codon:yes stop_codon:yes gene_type:complete